MQPTVGIDISKDILDAYRLNDGQQIQASNDKSGHQALITWIGGDEVKEDLNDIYGSIIVASMDSQINANISSGLPGEIKIVSKSRRIRINRSLGCVPDVTWIALFGGAGAMFFPVPASDVRSDEPTDPIYFIFFHNFFAARCNYWAQLSVRRFDQCGRQHRQ